MIDRDFSARERRKGEDVRYWMRDVQETLGTLHTAISPQCRSTKCDIKIPIAAGSGEVRLGEATRQ